MKILEDKTLLYSRSNFYQKTTGFAECFDGRASMSKFEQVVTDLGLDFFYIGTDHTLNITNRLKNGTTANPPSIPSHLQSYSQILHIANRGTAFQAYRS